MATHIDELSKFLGIAEKQGFLNPNTAQARRTACSKLFSVLNEDQRTVEYVSDHLDLIKTQFQHLNPEVRGQTVDEYARRVAIVLSDFDKWTTDRGAWERDVVARGARASGEGETVKRTRSEKAKPAAASKAEPAADDATTRVIKVPVRSGVEVSVTIPRDLTVSDLRRVLWALLPYATDWHPDEATPHQVFPVLADREAAAGR